VGYQVGSGASEGKMVKYFQLYPKRKGPMQLGWGVEASKLDLVLGLMMYHFLLLATRGSSVMGKIIIWGRCAHLRYVLKVEGFWYSRFILHFFSFSFPQFVIRQYLLPCIHCISS